MNIPDTISKEIFYDKEVIMTRDDLIDCIWNALISEETPYDRTTAKHLLEYIDEIYVNKLKQKLEKTKEALLQHGCHSSNCACLSDPNEEFDIPCTCGFSEALKEIGE